MQTLLTLSLGLSSLVSIYYVLVGRKAYQIQLSTNAELQGTLKEVQNIRDETVAEHQRIKQITRKLVAEAAIEPVASAETHTADPRRKTWLN